MITGFEFSGQRLTETDAGIAEMLPDSADGQFELERMLSGRITRLARAAFVGRGEDLERISPEVAWVPPWTCGRAIAWKQDRPVAAQSGTVEFRGPYVRLVRSERSANQGSDEGI